MNAGLDFRDIREVTEHVVDSFLGITRLAQYLFGFGVRNDVRRACTASLAWATRSS